MRSSLAACALACLCCCSVAAQTKSVRTFVNGNDLLESCSHDGGPESGVCLGYIMGIADTMSADQSVNGWTACIDLKVDANQVREVVVRALHREAAIRHKAARGLVAMAIAESFPCPAQ
jgi:hypothetical protein